MYLPILGVVLKMKNPYAKSHYKITFLQRSPVGVAVQSTKIDTNRSAKLIGRLIQLIV